jgi:hypothetical protein
LTFFPPISISGILIFFIADVKKEKKKKRNYREDAGMVKVLCYMLQGYKV